MLNKKYYTLADTKVTKRLTKLSTLNINLPSYKIKYKKHRIELTSELEGKIELYNEIDNINNLIYELKNKIHDNINYIVIMKKYQDADTFKKLIKHEYPIIEMELDDIFTYCEYTKNNILITNYIKIYEDKMLMDVNFLYLNNKI